MSDIICPISNEPMRTPVMAPCGHVFDKRSLLKHIVVTPKCPIDNQEIKADTLCFDSNAFQKIKESSEQALVLHRDTADELKAIKGTVNLTSGELETMTKINEQIFAEFSKLGKEPSLEDYGELLNKFLANVKDQMSPEIFQATLKEMEGSFKKEMEKQSVGVGSTTEEINIEDSKWWSHVDYINAIEFYKEFYGLNFSSESQKIFTCNNKIVICFGEFDVSFTAMTIPIPGSTTGEFVTINDMDKIFINGASDPITGFTDDLSYLWIRKISDDEFIVACKDIGGTIDTPRKYRAEREKLIRMEDPEVIGSPDEVIEYSN